MMPNHRNILWNGMAFVLCMVVCYASTAFVLNRVMVKGRRLMAYANPVAVRLGGQEYAMTRDFDPTQRYDVFVVGSSHAYRGYDPRNFEARGYRLFNAGSSAQHPTVSSLMLQSMLPKLQHKPLVVIDIFDRILEMDGGESSGRMMVNCAEPALAMKILMMRPDVVAINSYVCRTMSAEQCLETDLKDYVGDGYCTREGMLQKELDPLPMVFRRNDQAFQGLHECLDWLKNNGYSSVVVSHPMPPQRGREEFHGAAAAEVLKVTSSYGLKYYDFTLHDFGTDWKTYFWDATHLNQRGVDAFNDLLMQTLKADGVLP